MADPTSRDLLPPEKIKLLFTIKSIVVPIVAIAFLAWSIHDAHGLGPIVKQGSSLSGSALGWAFVSAVMSCVSNMATLVVNIPDFARLARKPSDTTWPQLIAIPFGFGITSLIGIIVSSSATVIYGERLWNPLDLLAKRLDLQPYDSAQRAGVFFIAAGFIIAQMGTNVAANSISAGSDLTALLPRYINIRRGGFLCAAVGLAMNPWKLVSSSSNFATYLSAYSLFLSSIAGVMITDYYVIRRGLLHVPSLYSASSSKSTPLGPPVYHFEGGFNLRAFGAYSEWLCVPFADDVDWTLIYPYHLHSRGYRCQCHWLCRRAWCPSV